MVSAKTTASAKSAAGKPVRKSASSLSGANAETEDGKPKKTVCRTRKVVGLETEAEGGAKETVGETKGKRTKKTGTGKKPAFGSGNPQIADAAETAMNSTGSGKDAKSVSGRGRSRKASADEAGEKTAKKVGRTAKRASKTSSKESLLDASPLDAEATASVETKAAPAYGKRTPKPLETTDTPVHANVADTAPDGNTSDVLEAPDAAKASGVEPLVPKKPVGPRLNEVKLSLAEEKRRHYNEVYKRKHVPSEAEEEYGLGKLPAWSPGWLLIKGARQNNLKGIDVPIPLSAFTAVTGVSGSGKSSLVEDILCPALSRQLNRSYARPGAFERILGTERLNKVIEVDQLPLGSTPTSNPATYTGLFDKIRDLYAQLPDAKLRGYSTSRFSFNIPGGRCEKCCGAGQIKIEMHFLPDVWVPCDACGGKRYDPQTLEVKYKGKSIADVLEMSCSEALILFASIPPIRRILKILCEIGLGYLALGQSATMLSGGEAQRIKLASELARPDTGRTLYVLDEPTTGLHFEDLRNLLKVIHRLVDLGNTVVVIEHNLDIVKSVDWVVDLGPEAGLNGGHLVFAGTPEELVEYGRRRAALPEEERASVPRSYTAEALMPVLDNDPYEERELFDPVKYQEELEALESAGEEEVVSDAPMPWEFDGRSWHTKPHLAKYGQTTKWNGRVLERVVDQISAHGAFHEPNWNHRAKVTVHARKAEGVLFFRASTDEEWLLKMEFTVPKDSFDEEELARDLYLKPLNDIEEIPLYGTQPRVRIETRKATYNIELKVYSLEEFDTPKFAAFIDRAMEEYSRYADELAAANAASSTDLAPWKTQGRMWHSSKSGFYGSASGPEWEMSLLNTVFDIIQSVKPDSVVNWTNNSTVSFFLPDNPSKMWCQVFTKNTDFVVLQINFPKGRIASDGITKIWRVSEVDTTDSQVDIVYLYFVDETDLGKDTLPVLLKRALIDVN